VFTGIVEACAPVRSFERARSGARLVVEAPALEAWGVRRGESVAVSGCCLTVAEILDSRGRPLADVAAGAAGPMAFDLSAETLERTWLGALAPIM
jgi:riboflavin synthase